MLIELIQSAGINAKKTSSTKGGEFHSACPDCGGRDRFTIWPEIGRYWCRQCKKSGNAIQFCRDFMGMSFQEACLRVESKMIKTSVDQKPAPFLSHLKPGRKKAGSLLRAVINAF